MGAADAVPGVAGGTVAFLSGIYDELVRSLNEIDRDAVKLLLRGEGRNVWQKINGNFLTAVFAGIITSYFTLARTMAWFLRTNPIIVLSFLFGFILLSAPLVLRDIKQWNLPVIVGFIAGILLAYVLTLLAPMSAPMSWWFLFASGILVVCASFLPGISGSLMLLLLGMYQFLVNAVANVNLVAIAIFVAGCLVGLFGFSRILVWALEKYRKATTAMLAGLMLGALNKVWPWRQVFEFATNSRGEQVPAHDKSILPWDYLATTGKDPHVFQAILMMALGVFIVFLIEKIAVRFKTTT
jgi:putative membrane protein